LTKAQEDTLRLAAEIVDKFSGPAARHLIFRSLRRRVGRVRAGLAIPLA
jgi:hypothetical protein